jgi:hypothetical protein
LAKRRSIQYLFALILLVFTFALCEVSFRAYDYVTTPQDNLNMDVWVKKTSKEVEEHPLLGYRRVPNQVVDDLTQADEFGMLNAREALAWEKVDVVGIGDSYIDLARRVFFERFKAHNVKYHSLAIFGYGPGTYNVLMKEYGPKLSPKVYVYSMYLGNDPGDVRRYESWRASGKSWYDYNGGYVFPIERRGPVWGWHLFLGRAKSFVRNLVSRINPDTYGALRGLVIRDDAETVFEYILQAKELARKQDVALLVVIVPRTPSHKPLLDPIAGKLLGLCAGKEIICLDLDPALGDTESRDKYFAPDGHWNEAGMHAAWTYLWDNKLQSLMYSQGATR